MAPVSPLHICVPESVSWLRPGHLPRGSWRETAFDLRLDKLRESPKPFFSSKNSDRFPYENPLYKNYSLCFPPPPGIYFLLSPFPFFHHLKLHVLFLVTSHGWSAAWFFLLPVASWQVADPAVDEEPGASMWGGGGGAWRKR